MAAGAASWFFGLGGYRYGAVLVIPLLISVPAILLGRSKVESKALWLFGLTVVVFAINTFVEANSPPSKGRLDDTLDGFDLPFFEEVEASTSGSSTCRPKCPQAERTWLAPSAARETAMAAAAGALAEAGYVEDPTQLFPRGEVPDRIKLRRGNETILVETERQRRESEATKVFLKVRITGSR